MKNLALFDLLFLSSSISYSQSSWERLNKGEMTDSTVYSLAFFGDDIYAGTHMDGVYIGEALGSNWKRAPRNSQMDPLQIWGMAATDKSVYAGTRGRGVFQLAAETPDWVEIPSGMMSVGMVQGLTIFRDYILAPTFGDGIYVRPVDADWASWVRWQVGVEDWNTLSVASNDSTMFIGTAGSNTSDELGVFYQLSYHDLMENGSWTKVNQGFGLNGAHLEGVLSIGANNQYVFAGTDDVGLYRKPINGTTWTQIYSYTGDIHSIAVQGSTIYYGTSYAGVYTSIDNGESWVPNNVGLAHGNKTIPYLVKDLEVHDGYMYAATDIGVFRQPLMKSGVANKVEGTARPGMRKYVDVNGCLVFELTRGEELIRYDLLGRRL
jgi:hypothetical protein